MKKAILIALGIILLPFLVLMILIFVTFYILPDPRLEQIRASHEYMDRRKMIRFENKLDSTDIALIFHFRYSPDNPLDSVAISRLEPDSYMSDSLYLNIYDYGESYVLPILKNDSIAFPQSFYIGVYREVNWRLDSLLKELDYESFKKYAIPKGVTKNEDFLSANEWTLVIDSTLLDLK